MLAKRARKTNRIRIAGCTRLDARPTRINQAIGQALVTGRQGCTKTGYLNSLLDALCVGMMKQKRNLG